MSVCRLRDRACTDVDECSTGAHTCDSNQTCGNTEGFFDCTCVVGWQTEFSQGARDIPYSGHSYSSVFGNAPAWQTGQLSETTYGWYAGANNLNQWMKLDLGLPQHVFGVATKGRQNSVQWVTTYIVETSLDDATWVEVDEGFVFAGNTDGGTLVSNMFHTWVVGRYVRIRPQTWNGAIAMRAGVIGPVWDCLNIDECNSSTLNN